MSSWAWPGLWRSALISLHRLTPARVAGRTAACGRRTGRTRDIPARRTSVPRERRHASGVRKLVPVAVVALALAACGSSHTATVTSSAGSPLAPTTSSTTALPAARGNPNSYNGSSPSVSCTYAKPTVTATVSHYGYNGLTLGDVLVLDSHGVIQNGGKGTIGVQGTGGTATGHTIVSNDSTANPQMLLAGTPPYVCVLESLSTDVGNGEAANYLYEDQTYVSGSQDPSAQLQPGPSTVWTTIGGLNAQAMQARPTPPPTTVDGAPVDQKNPIPAPPTSGNPFPTCPAADTIARDAQGTAWCVINLP